MNIQMWQMRENAMIVGGRAHLKHIVDLHTIKCFLGCHLPEWGCMYAQKITHSSLILCTYVFIVRRQLQGECEHFGS
jgi:hypothetical protein